MSSANKRPDFSAGGGPGDTGNFITSLLCTFCFVSLKVDLLKHLFKNTHNLKAISIVEIN